MKRLVEGPLAPVYEASKAKLWFDEIYDAIIIRPFRLVARGLYEIVDRFMIDTVAVNGSAMVVGLFVCREMVGVEPLASTSVDRIVGWLGPSFDELLRGRRVASGRGWGRCESRPRSGGRPAERAGQ